MVSVAREQCWFDEGNTWSVRLKVSVVEGGYDASEGHELDSVGSCWWLLAATRKARQGQRPMKISFPLGDAVEHAL
ncbi:hypothetical protein V6N12_029060 [Hibiscus sabdariffa]|uniref:Uncharacterized protein n=1 Tax=Hibiscus sabdariffa TaxID=183260 RepID=A0ABR2F7P4_9ROSI